VTRRALGLALLLSSAGSAAGAAPAASATDSCVECHAQLDEPRLSDPVRGFASDVHARRGLGCAGCHGGDPKDADITAMDPDKGFKGVPARSGVATMCATCHANAEFMKHYNPRPYIFSLAEWKTSVHCKKEAEGDQRVATCTSCHGVHGILSHRDPKSPVYPTNVPRTCARCHNPDYMKGRKVRADQFELYQASVHGVALFEKGDVSAPACNDCHGNHGAAPPGLKDVSLVCGTCHGREAELFDGSRMKAGMDREGKHGCVTCHGNHDVRRPTDAMLSAAPGGTCAGCHAPGSAAERGTHAIISGFHALQAAIVRADSLLGGAERRGMETARGRNALREAQDRLIGVRAGLHAFDPKAIGATLDEGAALAGEGLERAQAALVDWRNRRLGMGASVGVIVLLIALLVARIRRIDRET
jgi:hypothetical protein